MSLLPFSFPIALRLSRVIFSCQPDHIVKGKDARPAATKSNSMKPTKTLLLSIIRNKLIGKMRRIASVHDQDLVILSDFVLPKHVLDLLDRTKVDSSADSMSAIQQMRVLGLGDFGLVLSLMPIERYLRLSACLPPMTPSEITHRWTGNSPLNVMSEGLSFVRS